jgi:hypothetical protein
MAFGTLFGIWLALFLTRRVSPLVSGGIVVFAAALNLHNFGIWIYFIWQFVRPKARVLSPVTLLRPLLLFIVTVLAMSALHATILRVDADSYSGIPDDTTSLGEWGVGVFVAIETMATLGSGTIPARTAPSLAAVAYNCVASLAYSLFAVSLAFGVIMSGGGKEAKELGK